MSHRLGVIASPGVSLGVRLAGIRPVVVESRDAAAEPLEEMLADPRWGVILVQEDLMPDVLRGTAARARGIPIVVPFPAPRRERPVGEAEAYVTELLRQAVGYRVRLR